MMIQSAIPQNSFLGNKFPLSEIDAIFYVEFYFLFVSK